MTAVKEFACARCGATNADWLTFSAGDRYYCLGHVPFWARVRMWLRGVR